MSLTSGVHTNGILTRTAAAPIARGQLLKNATDGKVTPCAAATDVALYVAQWDAKADQNVPCIVLGNMPGTALVKVTAAVAIGDAINVLGAVAAAGSLTIGRALEVGAANDLIEVAHFATRTL